jgi:hypothetical protein
MERARASAGGRPGGPVPPATAEPGAQPGSPSGQPGAEPVPTPVPRAFAVRSPGTGPDNGTAG